MKVILRQLCRKTHVSNRQQLSFIKSESPWSRKSSAQQHPNQRLEGKGVLQSRVRNWIGQCRAGWLLHSNYSLSTQQYNANLIYSCYCPHGVKFKDLNIKNIYIYITDHTGTHLHVCTVVENILQKLFEV